MTEPVRSESADHREFAGRVAVITGAARGQGRSHALELARRGADIAVCDLGHDLATVGYPLSTTEDLAETVRLVEAEGRACYSVVADVRDLEAMIGFVDGAVATLGSADILVANAGVSTLGSICTMDATQWSETIDTNLTGVFNAMRATAPYMRRQRWGRIIGISSMMGRSSNPGIPAYVASKQYVGVFFLTVSLVQMAMAMFCHLLVRYISRHVWSEANYANRNGSRSQNQSNKYHYDPENYRP